MKINVQNYQTVSDISLDVKGFTVIVGKSNTGKTALLRAISGSFFNDPVTGNVRTGETDTIVTVEYRDIKWVWKKGENFNDYIITTPKGTEEYSRVGFKTPNEIVEAGFKEWYVDREKIRPQVASWYDPIFLLNRGGTAITELMTSVTRLDVVNLAIRNCATEQRKNRNVIKIREKDLQKATANVREFDNLKLIPMMEIEAKYFEYEQLESKLKQLDSFIFKYDEIFKHLNAFEKLSQLKIPNKFDIKYILDIERLGTWISKLENHDKILVYLNTLTDISIPKYLPANDLETLNSWIFKLELINKKLLEMEKLDLIKIPKIKHEKIYNTLQKIEMFMSGIYQIGLELKVLDDNILKETEILKDNMFKVTELRNQIETCQICGRS